MFTSGPEDRDSIPGRVIPKIQNMLLDTSLLNIQHYYGSRVSGATSEKK